MKKKNILILYGGEGREHDVSAQGAKFLLSVIDRTRYNPIPILITRSGLWRTPWRKYLTVHPERRGNRGILRTNDGEIPIDCAFPLLHGDCGEDGKIQGALDTLRIPYVGCTPTAGGICSDKILTKAIAESLGIKVAHSIYSLGESLEVAKFRAESFIGYPMFIKPSNLGSSVGCARALLPEDFARAFSAAARESKRILIEEYLEGAREIECAYLGTRTRGEIFTHPGEVIVGDVYTYEKKYSKNSDARILSRAPLDDDTVTRVKNHARRLVRAIGIRHLARIDFFLYEGEIIFNEINTMPGFTGASLYPRMLESAGVPPRELVTELIEEAMC